MNTARSGLNVRDVSESSKYMSRGGGGKRTRSQRDLGPDIKPKGRGARHKRDVLIRLSLDDRMSHRMHGVYYCYVVSRDSVAAEYILIYS